MKFRIFTEPQQGASYDDQLAIAQATERLGFNAFFRSDHFLAMDAPNGGLPGPTDAWLTLAALARETSGIRLGTLVSSATFRHPGLLAVQVAQVDQMSGGRVEFALGTGWFAAEHAAYGVPFRGSASACSRNSSRSSPACGTPRSASGSISPARTTPCATPRPCRSRPSSTSRSSSAAPGQSAHRAWRPASPTSTTCRSVRSPRRMPPSPGCARRSRRPGATPAR